MINNSKQSTIATHKYHRLLYQISLHIILSILILQYVEVKSERSFMSTKEKNKSNDKKKEQTKDIMNQDKLSKHTFNMTPSSKDLEILENALSKIANYISNPINFELLRYLKIMNEELQKPSKHNLVQEFMIAEILAKINSLRKTIQTREWFETDFEKLIKDGINKIKSKNILNDQEIAEIINPKRAKILEYPIDKINSKVWAILKECNKIDITFAAEKKNSKEKLNIYYSIDFEKISEKITSVKRLLPFDKRVYISISALFNSNNSIVTLTQIYYAMGYTGKPGTSDLKKINESILKMLKATISINNEQEAQVYKKYGKFIYRGSLLPVETSEYHNFKGKLTDAAIHIFREPPLISFAKQRKQVTTVSIELLQSPVSKTNTNLMIDDYLIERIARSKNNKSSQKILYKTLYKKVGITTSKQKQRTPEKIERYLEHYKKCGSIERYTMEETGLTIYF